ncbi:unnamed protein product [Gadus morhua 'NCC']
MLIKVRLGGGPGVSGAPPACQGPPRRVRAPPGVSGARQPPQAISSVWRRSERHRMEIHHPPPLPSHPSLRGGGAGPVIPYTAPDRRRGGARHPLHTAGLEEGRCPSSPTHRLIGGGAVPVATGCMTVKRGSSLTCRDAGAVTTYVGTRGVMIDAFPSGAVLSAELPRVPMMSPPQYIS